MSNDSRYVIEPIAYIKNGFDEKFGIPRQSGLANTVKSEIFFCKKYSDENMLRDIEQYSHLWLIWGFSENAGEWSPTVRPPKLGGNKRVGVLATRSPYRPNNLGLSCVALEGVFENDDGTLTLVVYGADLKNCTPIFDIKPYLPYVDCVPHAKGGFSDDFKNEIYEVVYDECVEICSEWKREIADILSYDPRPQYHEDESRVYGFKYKGHDVKFVYNDGKIIVKQFI